MRSARTRNRDRFFGFIALMLIAGGCAGNGCSCMAPLPNGFPAEERHPNAVQARVSSTGIQFLEDNAAAVIGGVVPGGLSFDVPPTCGGDMEVCCDSMPGECVIEVDMDPRPGDPPRLELSPNDPPGNQLGVLVRARVRTLNPLPISYDTGFGTINCDVSVNTESSGQPSLSVVTAIDFPQDAQTGTTRMEVGTVDVQNLDDGDIDIDGGFACDFADAFKSFFIGQIEGQLESQIQETIGSQVCKQCENNGNCAPFATCNGDGICELPDGACLQELGTSGRLEAASLFSSLSPGQAGAMDLYDVAGGYARSNAGGLSLGVLGGGIPADGIRSPCVAADDPPAEIAIPESPFFAGNTRPDTGAPFDIAIGMHEFFLNQNGYAAYAGGLLCLNVGTRSIDLLSSDTFSILVPSLNDLLHFESAPMILALRPQQRPELTLGAGTFTTSPSGETVIDEPLITIFLPQLEIDFYAVVDQRYVRIFTLRTDVTLPLGLQVNEVGELVPVFGDVENAFTNISVSNAELLAETPTEIADRFPAILSIALPFLGDALGGFALPEFAGVQITVPPGGITSVENNTFLAIFGDLEVAAGKRTRVDTYAEIRELRVPPTEDFAPIGKLDRSKRPVVELFLGGVGTDGTDRDLEWQYRIDHGLWSAWTRSRTVRLSREGFWLQGRHIIEVRAREVGFVETVDAEPVVLEALIDTLPPEVTVVEVEDGVLVGGRDRVSPEEALVVTYRVGGGAWTYAGLAPAVVPLVEGVEIQVSDEAGNAALADMSGIWFHGRAPAGDGCSCTVGAASSGRGALGGGLALLVIAGVVALGVARRRWFRWVPVIALAASSVACGGTSDGVGQDAGLEDDVHPGPIGRWSDIAASEGRVVVSAYEEQFGDLVFGERQEGGWVRYWVVDGAPAEPVVLDPTGYRGGVSAAGEDVGAWTSIKLQGSNAIIAYQDRDAGALKFATEDGGAWKMHVVDDGGGATAGLYASLSIDSAGVPGIAYMVMNIDDGLGGRRAALRWAQAGTASPASASDWSITTISEVAVPCTNLCGDVMVCVTETNLCAMEEPATCTEECMGDTACVGGSCVAITPNVPTDLPEGTGLFASAGHLPDGRAVVAYYDRSTVDLMLAVSDGAGGWQLVPLDAADETDRGQWASLAVAPDGVVHVAYQDSLLDRLLHVSWSNGTVGAIEVVDDGDRAPDRPHPVGASAALVADAQGNLRVAYQDAATSDLLVATSNGDGTWSRSDLMATTAGVGFFTSAAADGSTVWVSTYEYDRADPLPLGELVVVQAP